MIFISSNPLGSVASRVVEGAAGPAIVRVPGAEGGSQEGAGLSRAEGREWAASAKEEGVAGSCCTPAEVGGMREA